MGMRHDRRLGEQATQVVEGSQKWCCDDPEALQGHLACTKLFMTG